MFRGGHLYLLVLTLSVGSSLLAQGYRSPLDIPLLLAGSFGELRGSHFHSGMDIKTDGKTGLKVYAIADGYVSRIKVSATGFGYALYIDHPNGYTSVYGHLQQYNAIITDFTKKIQYAKESFEIDTLLPPNLIKIKKGDVIALSGNSGASGGPHLHFEVRNTKSEKPYNPQKMGFALKDHIAPEISELYIYPLDGGLPEMVKVEKKGNTFTVKKPITTDKYKVGFGVRVNDKMDNNPSIDDIYQLTLKVDGKTVYRFSLDSFSFDDTKYVQAHEDYWLKLEKKKTVQRLYRLPGNFILLYDSLVNNGLVKVPNTKPMKVAIAATDAVGNSSTLNFTIQSTYDAQTVLVKNEPQTPFRWDKENHFKNDDLEITMPPHNLYEDIDFYFHTNTNKTAGVYSKNYFIYFETVPIHKNYQLTLKAINFPQRLLNKAVLVHKTHDGDIVTYDGTWQGDKLKADVKEFGEYYIGADTVSPIIKPINIAGGKDMGQEKYITVIISDSLSGIKTYHGTIDGHWVLMELDAKTGTLRHAFEKSLLTGEHQFSLTVTDRVNNETNLQLTFKK